MIATIKNIMRNAKIRRLQNDLDWARASSDAHIVGLEDELSRLRREQCKYITSDDVARTVSRGGIMSVFAEEDPPLMVQIAYGLVIFGAFLSMLLFVFGGI
jgi:hypothetical protein